MPPPPPIKQHPPYPCYPNQKRQPKKQNLSYSPFTTNCKSISILGSASSTIRILVTSTAMAMHGEDPGTCGIPSSSSRPDPSQTWPARFLHPHPMRLVAAQPVVSDPPPPSPPSTSTSTTPPRLFPNANPPPGSRRNVNPSLTSLQPHRGQRHGQVTRSLGATTTRRSCIIRSRRRSRPRQPRRTHTDERAATKRVTDFLEPWWGRERRPRYKELRLRLLFFIIWCMPHIPFLSCGFCRTVWRRLKYCSV